MNVIEARRATVFRELLGVVTFAVLCSIVFGFRPIAASAMANCRAIFERTRSCCLDRQAFGQRIVDLSPDPVHPGGDGDRARGGSGVRRRLGGRSQCG